MDSSARSIAKTVSYRIIGSAITMAITWAITGGMGWAITVGFVDMALKCIAYYLHERLWNFIPFGRKLKE